MRAAEVGRLRVLADLDDAAPDRARAGKQIEQRVTVAPADRARKRRYIFVDAPEHLEDRVFVVEEYVAPHGRIGRGYAGEVAKTAGRELHHLGTRDCLQIVGGADDRIGDEMRHV